MPRTQISQDGVQYGVEQKFTHKCCENIPHFLNILPFPVCPLACIKSADFVSLVGSPTRVDKICACPLFHSWHACLQCHSCEGERAPVMQRGIFSLIAAHFSLLLSPDENFLVTSYHVDKKELEDVRRRPRCKRRKEKQRKRRTRSGNATAVVNEAAGLF